MGFTADCLVASSLLVCTSTSGCLRLPACGVRWRSCLRTIYDGVMVMDIGNVSGANMGRLLEHGVWMDLCG